MTLQNAQSITVVDGVTADEQALQYGKIQGEIAAKFTFRDLVNTNYLDEPIKGATIKVARWTMAVSQAYGAGRTAGVGNKLSNNYGKVEIDTSREFNEEVHAMDIKLYENGGAGAVLNARRPSYVLGMGIELETAYYAKLQEVATLVDVSAGADLQDKLTKLIQKLERVGLDTVNKNVNGVDRAFMVLTVKPWVFDALEKVITTLANPITGRTDEKYFRQVAIRSAVRLGGEDDADAIVQVYGSLAQPVVMDDFYMYKPQASNDLASYMSYYYGTDAITADLVYKADVGTEDVSA